MQSFRVATGAGNVTASSPGLHDLAFSRASPAKVVAAGISGQVSQHTIASFLCWRLGVVVRCSLHDCWGGCLLG